MSSGLWVEKGSTEGKFAPVLKPFFTFSRLVMEKLDSLTENAELLLTIDTATLELVDAGVCLEGPVHIMQLCMEDGSWVGLVHVGDYNIPLAPSMEMQVQEQHEEDGRVTFKMQTKDDTFVLGLEPGTPIDGVERLAELIQLFIRPQVAGTVQPTGPTARILRGLSVRLERMTDQAVNVIQSKAPDLSDRVSKSLNRICDRSEHRSSITIPAQKIVLGLPKQLTGMGVRVSHGLATTVAHTLDRLIPDGALIRPLEKGPDGGKRKELARLIETSTCCFGTICTELEVAGGAVLDAGTSGMKKLADVRYGPQAAQAADDACTSVHNSYRIYRNVRKLGYRALAKAVVKKSVRT